MRGVSILNLLLTLALANEEPACYLPIDVVFLQDTTGSFVQDLPNVVKQIPSMTEQILAQNPDSHWAVAEFRDKPYWPLGESNEFCYRLHSELQPDVGVFEKAYARLFASGGGDIPESQFQALINVAKDPAVGWRPLRSSSREMGSAGARLVIISTDANVHLPGDMSKLSAYPDVPQNLPANPGNLDSITLDEACTSFDYPDGYQMKAALDEMDIMLAILTPNDDAKVVSTWKWINEDLLEQPAEFYQFIASDSSDLISGVLKAIKAFTQYTCLKTTTTTTRMPTTKAPTTPDQRTTYSSTTLPTTTTQSTPSTTTIPSTTLGATSSSTFPLPTTNSCLIYDNTTTPITITGTTTVSRTGTITGTRTGTRTGTITGTTTGTRTGTTTGTTTGSITGTRTGSTHAPASTTTSPLGTEVVFHSAVPLPLEVSEPKETSVPASEIVDPDASTRTYVGWRPLPATATEWMPYREPCCPALKVEVNGEPQLFMMKYVGPEAEIVTEEEFPSDYIQWVRNEEHNGPLYIDDRDFRKH